MAEFSKKFLGNVESKSVTTKKRTGLNNDVFKGAELLIRELLWRDGREKVAPDSPRARRRMSDIGNMNIPVPMGPRPTELPPRLQKVSRHIKFDLLSVEALHPLVEAGISAAELEDFLDAVALELKPAMMLTLNPFAAKRVSTLEVREKSRALRIALRELVKERRDEIQEWLSPNPEFLNDLESGPMRLERRLNCANSKRKVETRGRRVKDTPKNLGLSYIIKAVGKIARKHFGTRLRKRPAFVMSVLRTKTLSEFLLYDPKTITKARRGL
jgi:hypothetical protein